MKFRALNIENNPETKPFIKDFKVEDVIFDNYFFSSDKNLLQNNFQYSEDEISLILHLTDTEYAELLKKYQNQDFKVEISQEDRVKQQQVEEKIQDLELKLTKSREYEEAGRKKTEFEGQLKKLQADLTVAEEFNIRHEEARTEFAPFEYLSKYNLQKIHEDLLGIDKKILDLESQLLESKKEFITYNIRREGYDKGKIVLSIFWMIGIGLICTSLFLLRSPLLFVVPVFLIGSAIALFILFTAKMEYELPKEVLHTNVQYGTLEEQIVEQKNIRSKILDFIGVGTTSEFFQLKAQFNSQDKKLKYIRENKDRVLASIHDYEKLVEDKVRLEKEIENLQLTLNDKSSLLPPEEYLRIRREIDTLKLEANKQTQVTGISKEGLLQKLKDIRKELMDKIPGYAEVLRNTFASNYQNITTTFEQLQSNLSLPPITVDSNGGGYKQLSNIQKILLQYSLMKEIYNSNYVFILPFLSHWNEEDKTKCNEFIEKYSDESISWIGLD